MFGHSFAGKWEAKNQTMKKFKTLNNSNSFPENALNKKDGQWISLQLGNLKMISAGLYEDWEERTRYECNLYTGNIAG